MTKPIPERCARQIDLAFEHFRHHFETLSRRAKVRFEQAQWELAQLDSQEKQKAYNEAVARAVEQLRENLAEQLKEKEVWNHIKLAFKARRKGKAQEEIARTFFNSVTRRIFSTVGVNPQIEFLRNRASKKFTGGSLHRSYSLEQEPLRAVRRVLVDAAFDLSWEDRHRDAALAIRRLDPESCQLQVLKTPFFRNQGAYLIGRQVQPDGSFRVLALAILQREGRLYLDAVITTESELSRIFSFTRSYFSVDSPEVEATVSFLRSVLPQKPVAELYISLGYTKHGKTHLFRDFVGHLKKTTDQFVEAPGQRGMVMLVFTLPSYDVVFKIIKDRFAYPKSITRSQVKQKYALVFDYNRLGRLVDFQEFEHLRFSRDRFQPELLELLLKDAPATVELSGDHVVVHHAYTQRQITPLDLYLKAAGPEQVDRAVIEYGQCIRELAQAGIFAGDMFLKNFGVTRHGRVVFYDYDELCLLKDCRFRSMKVFEQEDDFMDEPVVYVGPDDVFPEQFPRFLGLFDEQAALFSRHHGELFTVDFWKHWQANHQMVEIFPYDPASRL